MTLKNSEILNIIGFANSQESFVNKVDAKLPIKFAWNWRKNIKKIRECGDTFDELQKELMEAYADDEHSEETENGRIVKSDYAAEYTQKIQELYSQENEIDICKVDLEDFGDVELSIPEMEAISFMIND